MPSLPLCIRIFVARDAVDLRKAHDEILAVIRDAFGDDPFDGNLFVFLNRGRDRVKLLQWDRDGFWLHYKVAETTDSRATVAACDVEIAAQAKDIRTRELNVDVFRLIACGGGSEKRGSRKLPDSESPLRQQHLWLTELVAEAGRIAEKAGTHGSIAVTPSEPGRSPSKRCQKLPSHLPRVRATCELPPDRLGCECGCQMEEFGEDVASELIRVELTLVHEIARNKCGCKKCGGAARTAPGPGRVIEKGLLSSSFLADVIND